MTKLLIAVHGMGSNPPEWSARIRDKLDAVASRYVAFAGGARAFHKNFTFAEVQYDAIVERYVVEWGAQADEFEAFLDDNPSPLPKGKWSQLFDWLTDTTLPEDEKDFFWSTLIDPILYRGFPIVRDEVRANVMAQIVDHMTKSMADGAVQVSILAHSLGTAVTHDVLQLLASGAAGGNRAFEAREWKFENLFMLADVALLGPRGLIDLKPSDPNYLVIPRSAVPVDSGPGTYYCTRFHSFRHEWDPFIRWAPLEPTSWGPGWGADFRAPAPFSQIQAANVHGFTHYLDNPAVHIPIINAMMGFSAIDKKEERDAIAAYPPLGSPECSAVVESLGAFIKSLPAAGENLPEIAIQGSRFFAEVRKAAVACKGLGGDLGD